MRPKAPEKLRGAAKLQNRFLTPANQIRMRSLVLENAGNMHKLLSTGILAEGPNNLKVIKYFHPLFCHNHSLNKPNICAKLKSSR